MSAQRWLVPATLFLAACSDYPEPLSPALIQPGEPRFSASVTLACPTGWTEAYRGTAVLRCTRTRSFVVEHVVFANLKGRARVDMVHVANSVATRSTPSPDFQKKTIGNWWAYAGAAPGAYCTVSGTFFMDMSASATTKLSFPLKSGGILRSTGSDLNERGARILSIRSDEAWINRFDLATTDFDKVTAALTEQNMIVGLPIPNGTSLIPKGRSYIGLKDLDNDNFAETIFFYVSPSATERQAANAVQSIGYRNIIQMDGSGSAQLNCAGNTLVSGDGRKIPQVFLVADLPRRAGIHRSYRHAVPDHLYGHDPNEGIPHGYVLEQANYFWLATTNGGSGYVPVYRCLWGGNRHLVTRDYNCEGAGSREAVLGYGMTSQVSGTVPLYRLYNPRTGDHLYTTSDSERRAVLAAGWTYEGVTAYVWTAA